MYKQVKQKHHCSLTVEELRKLDALRPFWRSSTKPEVKEEIKPIQLNVSKPNKKKKVSPKQMTIAFN